MSEAVILLHGLARSASSMAKLEGALSDNGYEVLNIDYPSTKHDIEALADLAIAEPVARLQHKSSIHFVTHSMGGILVRHFLHENTLPNLGKVVMLGPPNHGSEVVDKLHKLPGFKTVNGPAGLQLATNDQSVPNQLGPADFELGIIAGSRSINLILSTLIPQPNDGKVSVESSKVDGMNDHLTLPVTHTFMMRNKEVIEQVLGFLQNGEFQT
ncbi:alpha/beta fold hydrolase [Glaciecola sp. MH2013]|uniref:esterase/lipase family protein n=1 Tax=Glaciecola sp. MH2013 TaxID=2785524 RepID=UPI00189E7385|nr:alpha/beta fold hydrolase [Glaciecola sp. MH2013]MBF7072568.1 alpha/beta fold hydrolase [Glaciecola sp. MH2013]